MGALLYSERGAGQGLGAPGSWLLFGLALLLMLGSSADAQNLTITGVPAYCGRGAFTDGCAGAQSTGSWQKPNFFTGYTGTSYGVNRPPWNVAGVDYPVGYDNRALRDPSVAGNLPACATYSANVVTVNSAPCTIDHFDFSLHNAIGLNISSSIVNGALVTITNNKFTYGSGHDPAGGSMIVAFGGGTLDLMIKYNHFDGIYSFTDSCSATGGGCPTALIVFSAIGTVTLEYNALLNTNQHNIQHNKPGTLIDKFNYTEGLGLAPSHADDIISNNAVAGTSQTIIYDYNTGYAGPSGANGGAFVYFTSGNSTSTTVSGEANNNTLVSAGASVPMSFLFRLDAGGTIGAVAMQNNWVDPGGSFGTFEGHTAGLTGPVTCSGNKNLKTGATVTFSGPFTCN